MLEAFITSGVMPLKMLQRFKGSTTRVSFGNSESKFTELSDLLIDNFPKYKSFHLDRIRLDEVLPRLVIDPSIQS